MLKHRTARSRGGAYLTVHLYWTIRRNTYSLGLLTSMLYVIIFYLLIRYGVDRHLFTRADFAIGTTVGVVTVGTFLWMIEQLNGVFAHIAGEGNKFIEQNAFACPGCLLI